MAIVSQIPINFATNVIRNIFIRIKFDQTVDRSTVNDYTAILVETDNPNNIIPGHVDYIVGTKEVTFQLFDFLKSNTNYTMILVGGTAGIHVLTPTRQPFNSGNYVFSFTVGEIVDSNVPLATQGTYEDGPYFQGEGGIYKQVFGRTGEPVTHIVTTAAQVGPSGTIVPAPFGADRYIAPSGEYDEDAFKFTSSDPEDGSINNINSNIKFLFNSSLKSVESVVVRVSDILGEELTNESNISNYDFTIDNKEYVVTPSGLLTGLANAADYEIILNNVKDVIDRVISSIKIIFRTKIIPMYTTVKIVRINLGSLIRNVSDSEIQDLIYENSLWAFDNAKEPFLIDKPTMAAKNYTMCKTKLDLLERHYIKGGTIMSKQLADLRIEYGPGISSIIENKIDKLEKCVEKNALILTTGSGFIKSQSAEKSYFDARRPNSHWRRLNNNGSFEEL